MSDPTLNTEVEAWLVSLGCTQPPGTANGFWYHKSFGYIDARSAAFFYAAILKAQRAENQAFADKWHNFGLVMVDHREKDVDGDTVVYQERKPIDRLLKDRIAELDRLISKGADGRIGNESDN